LLKVGNPSSSRPCMAAIMGAVSAAALAAAAAFWLIAAVVED
jgi:hypothetical protein